MRFAAFGTSTSSGGLFGTTNTTSNPFGGTSSLFGSSGFTSTQPGTTIKFNVFLIILFYVYEIFIYLFYPHLLRNHFLFLPISEFLSATNRKWHDGKERRDDQHQHQTPVHHSHEGVWKQISRGQKPCLYTIQLSYLMTVWYIEFNSRVSNFQELRLEDYQAGRKGPTNGLFGATATPTPSTATGLFGASGTGFSFNQAKPSFSAGMCTCASFMDVYICLISFPTAFPPMFAWIYVPYNDLQFPSHFSLSIYIFYPRKQNKLYLMFCCQKMVLSHVVGCLMYLLGVWLHGQLFI